MKAAWVQMHASVVQALMSVATAAHSVGQEPPSWLYHEVMAVSPTAEESTRAVVVVSAAEEVEVRSREEEEAEEETEEVVRAATDVEVMAVAGSSRTGTASRRPSETQVLAYAG